MHRRVDSTPLVVKRGLAHTTTPRDARGDTTRRGRQACSSTKPPPRRYAPPRTPEMRARTGARRNSKISSFEPRRYASRTNRRSSRPSNSSRRSRSKSRTSRTSRPNPGTRPRGGWTAITTRRARRNTTIEAHSCARRKNTRRPSTSSPKPSDWRRPERCTTRTDPHARSSSGGTSARATTRRTPSNATHRTSPRTSGAPTLL
mmetsp:Transcript_10009/g.45767  ORF Transcript_10009/g.45767 Transcript_10009/m.45767 type:complete len:203 (-) Transcript_10009:5702-6310(-)